MIFVVNRAVYEIMWTNMVQPDRPQVTVKYGAEKIRVACRITEEKIQTGNCKV
jgi:hypothetical protein